MKRVSRLVAAIFLVAACGCSSAPVDRDVVFQASTLDALMAGAYDGQMTCGELRGHGDLGLGTFDALDGEMVVLDGTVYRVRADGRAEVVDDRTGTPFAVVTPFDADIALAISEPLDYGQLQERLNGAMPTANAFYALRVEGHFDYVKTRSVPRQRKPYPPLVEVVKDQPTFEFRDVRGTMVGFRFPSSMQGLNVPGYHLHFLTEGRTAGGHVLECEVGAVTAEIDEAMRFTMVLPDTEEFRRLNLTGGASADVEKVER